MSSLPVMVTLVRVAVALSALKIPPRSMVTVVPSAILSVLLLSRMSAETVMFAPSFCIAARNSLSVVTLVQVGPRPLHDRAQQGENH